jgi:hypothetical protein
MLSSKALAGLARHALVGAGLAVLHAGSAAAQGQDAQTSAMAGQTAARPVPLLSTIEVISVPGGQPVAGLPVAPAIPPDGGPGLVLPGPVALRSPDQLHCGDIQDPTGRARCEARTTPPAPPAGGAS